MTDVFKNAISQIFTTLASNDDDIVVVTYKPIEGDIVSSVNAHYRKESFGLPSDFTFQATAYERYVEALFDDLGQLPQRGDLFEITSGNDNGVELEVQEAQLSDGKTVRAVVKLS